VKYHDAILKMFQEYPLFISRCEEYWVPKENVDLDTLKVVRQIPTIHILLSIDPLDTTEPR